MLHGTRRPLTPHIGLCLTDDEAAADAYAEGNPAARRSGEPVVHRVELALTGLRVMEARSFVEGSRDACGDTEGEIKQLQRRRVDVVVFEDEAPGGCRHRTWRIVSKRALKALTVL